MTTPSHLTPAVIFVVIGAGALHACWNAVIKPASDRLMMFAWLGISSAACGGVVLMVTGLPDRPAIPFAIASAIIHIGYELALMNAYRLGAFNQAYPIARGTSPLVVAVGAYVFAGERLSALALTGVLMLAVGLMSLALSSGRLSMGDAPAVGAATLTGLTIAAYTVVDGLGVRRAGDAAAYAALLFVLEGPVLAIAAAIRRQASAWRDPTMAGRGLLAGALSVAAYGIVLWAQTRAPLAPVAAIREISVVFAALIGAMLFDEDFGGRRVASAVVIAAGIVLIGV